jgi:hypothetical protein
LVCDVKFHFEHLPVSHVVRSGACQDRELKPLVANVMVILDVQWKGIFLKHPCVSLMVGVT